MYMNTMLSLFSHWSSKISLVKKSHYDEPTNNMFVNLSDGTYQSNTIIIIIFPQSFSNKYMHMQYSFLKHCKNHVNQLWYHILAGFSVLSHIYLYFELDFIFTVFSSFKLSNF